MKHQSLLLLLSSFLGLTPLLAWTPGTGSPNAVAGFVVDTTDRRDSLAFYNCVYFASEGYASRLAWTGNTAGGVAGTTGASFKDDVRRRVNFYRALSSLPADITFDVGSATKSSQSQDAALMMSRNKALNHTPPTTWLSYTAGGAAAAGSSNLALGYYGPPAIDAYMVDSGTGNEEVGHRRWITYSRAADMGTGDVPISGTYSAANSLWVIGNFKAAPTPQFVAWPNAGFVPLNLSPARWSVSYPGAVFTAATVTMSQAGTNVPVSIISNNAPGYGDNTLIWEPTGLPTSLTADKTYQVTISNITGLGVPTTWSYNVTLFDPNDLGTAATVTGSQTPPTTGANYTFNSIEQADAYQLSVAQVSSTPWTEGAEDSPAPQITPSTTGTYTLRQATTKRTGSKAFHLTFPDSSNVGPQSFQITRDIIPSATSSLVFYNEAGYTVSTTTLSAEISTDNGITWTSLWSRNGVGAAVEAAFKSVSISLASYAGKVVEIRFIMRNDPASLYVGTDTTLGYIIDDISVSNATQLVSPQITALAANATGFTLNSTTAGAALSTSLTYALRISPEVGLHFYGFGPVKLVIPATLTGYNAWVQGQYPSITGGVNGDQDNDGLTNGLEYAFGLNPLVKNNATALPQPAIAGSNYVVSFTQPSGIVGVVYAMQSSTDLVTWKAIPDTGSGGVHTFSVSTTGLSRLFVRHVITVTP